MIICGIDLESTGVDVEKDRITEIGIVLGHVDKSNKFEIYTPFSTLVYETDYPSQSEEVIAVTGITDEDLRAHGVPFKEALTQITLLYETYGAPHVYIAHNADFDRELFKNELARYGRALSDTPWICTMRDMQHPEKFKCRKLSHLALDYGVPVDPRTLHRTIGDISLMLDMMQASGVDFCKLLERSKLPSVVIRAIVPAPFGPKGDNGVGKEKAKACGFRWDGKFWVKQIKINELDQEQERLGYGVTIVENYKG